MSSEPPYPSSGATAAPPTDPVSDLFVSAGLSADPQVRECALLAATTHAQRFADNRADSPAVNRSTLLWALWRVDETVRVALERNGGRIEAFERELGISGVPGLADEQFRLGDDLTRALRSAAGDFRSAASTVTPAMVAIAILQDVVANGGLLAQRLQALEIDAGGVLDTLGVPWRAHSEPTAEDPGASLVRIRDLTPQRFGVHLIEGADRPGPYVGRDVDGELDRLLGERGPVVSVVAPPMSGAIRSVYESLLRTRPDDRVLLLHDFVGPSGSGRSPEAAALDRAWRNRADVVWVRNLGELLDGSPLFEDWFRRRRNELRSTLVAVLRPEDRGRASGLGLLAAGVVEITGGLSPDERIRARGLYRGDPATVAAVATARSRRREVLRASYAADTAAAAGLIDADADDLDIRSDVDMLAKLIASKHVHPPLSIGLFGPWGSGKSFLMRQVQLRIADLAEKSRHEAASGYHREIVPVEFNAWQYAHGSALWAALINRVFQQIQQKLGGDERYQKVLRDIAVKDVGVARAQAKLEAAREKVEQSRHVAKDRAIKEVVDDHHMADDAMDRLLKGLNLDAATSQISDLRTEYDRLTTTTARLNTGWATASLLRRAAFLGLLLAALAVVAVHLLMPEAVKQLGALVGVFVTVAAAVLQLLRPVNRALTQAAEVLNADDADQRELQRAQNDLDQACRDLAEAKASGLAGLYGFVSDRSSSAEYRQQLGMAPVIRDDLERLARLSKIDEGLQGIDRIVIFIDDLDRCPAAEVVRVLEAVNLLFGFELFVVVVAVDSRWLLRSLEGTFSEAFDADDSAAPTPQNYLEKIIQIPFWLPPMEAPGFGRLVTSLAGEVDTSRAQPASTNGSNPSWHVGADTAARDAADEPFHADESHPDWIPPVADGSTVRSADIDAHGDTGTDEVYGAAQRAADRVAVADRVSDEGGSEDLDPKALQLSPEELALMVQFHPLVGTPRAVKRFLNTYQLLRVSVDDVDAFLDNKEHEPVLILLALLTGTVPMSDRMIDQLRSMSEASLAEFLADMRNRQGIDLDRAAEWSPLVLACAALPTTTLTPAVIAKWLPRAARYSFHPVGASAD